MTDQKEPVPRNGNGTRRVIDRLAELSVPVLLGALGMVLWSMLGGVVDGVDANRAAIIELKAAIENLTAMVDERTADLWTAAQEEQQQAIQVLVDQAQNEQLIDAKTQLQSHQSRLEAIAVELAVGDRRIDTLEGAVGTPE
jgi:hypothetical protein